MTRNWREVAERWQKFIKTPVGNTFLTYQTEHDKAIVADTELSFLGGDPTNEHIRNLHRKSERALESLVKEVEILLEEIENNQKLFTNQNFSNSSCDII